MFDNLPLLFYCCLLTAIWKPLPIADSNEKMQQNVQYSWELSSKFKSLSKYYILCFDITFSHMKDARGAIWQGDLRLPMNVPPMNLQSLWCLLSTSCSLITTHTHKARKHNKWSNMSRFFCMCVCNQQKRLVSSDDDDNM